MPDRIVEDRVLAQIAYHAVGRGAAAGSVEAADMAYGHAVIALRVHGIAAGPEMLRVLRAEVEGIVGDPERVARAHRFARGPERPRAANRNARPAAARRAAG